jgi:hypothetical protein
VFLPFTPLIHGRKSKPRSHYWYKVIEHLPPSKKVYVDPDGGTLVELRSSDGNTSVQTVVPPTVHESGDQIEWEEYGEPSVVDGDELAHAMRRVAVVALLARYWPKKGNRHEAALAVSGFLLRAGLDEDLVAKVIETAATIAKDEQVKDRVVTVYDTAEKLADEKPTTGGTTLAGIMGDKIIKKLGEWLGTSTRQSRTNPAPIDNITSIAEKLHSPGTMRAEDASHSLLVTNYPEDEVVPHALLETPSVHTWPVRRGTPCYTYKRKLTVYFATENETPMSLEEAIARIQATSPAAILTMRIALSMWNRHRREGRLCANGDAAIKVSDILTWRGLQKRSRLVDGIQKSDGWDPSALKSVWEDLRTIASIRITGDHEIHKRGNHHWRRVTSPYIRIASAEEFSRSRTPVLADVFISPGVWFVAYEKASNYFLAPVEQALFQLNPQNERHEVRIGLYLVERWRKLANSSAYDAPIRMQDLLQESVITVERANLTNRFVPRIERALDQLHQKGIVGLYGCLTPIEREKRNWGEAWLSSEWYIRPPGATVEALERIVHGELSEAA